MTDTIFFKSLCVSSADDFCRTFDLTYKVPRHFLDQAIQSSQLVLLDASSDWTRLIDLVAESLGASQDAVPVRICIPLLGSPGWGDPHPKVRVTVRSRAVFSQCDTLTKDVLQFVYSLRTLLRRCPHACASVGLPAYMSADSWGGPGWLNKLSWLFDASVTIAGFSGEGKRRKFPACTHWLNFFFFSWTSRSGIVA